MRNLLILLMLFAACSKPDANPVKKFYYKKEFQIPMRDGKALFTSVYIPKDQTKSYPLLMTRTPYRVAPYGEDIYRTSLGPSPELQKDGYIFVYQDVRGKFMSEGEYIDVRPYQPDKQDSLQVDETTDTYDTIEWLVKNIPNNNGRVGVWGISYPGFYASMSLIDAHPALRAVSPQAPIGDWFIGDDMHHHGAFSLTLAFNFYAGFGAIRPELTEQWSDRFKINFQDGYRFFLAMGPLKTANEKYFKGEIPFWNDLMKNETYTEFWKARTILPYLKNVKPAVLVVGGWYDAEDLFGALHTYQSIERQNPGTDGFIVMGPWAHGGWARQDGDSLGDIGFGSNTSIYYQREIESRFFNYYLKDQPGFAGQEAVVFDTGLNRWQTFNSWPPVDSISEISFYLLPGQRTDSLQNQSIADTFESYISDPAKPVPFIDEITSRWGQKYMVADQRFASTRPDVLVFESMALNSPLTIAGPIEAELWVSTSGTDADFVVKLIDVYPDSAAERQPNPCGIKMQGYQRLIRAEIFRGKFRESYKNPVPFKPGQKTLVTVPLQDIFHTFKPGHKMMIQVQSTWFPLFDINPQSFVNIYTAEAEDFRKAEHRVYTSGRFSSALRMKRMKK